MIMLAMALHTPLYNLRKDAKLLNGGGLLHVDHFLQYISLWLNSAAEGPGI